MFTCCVRTLPVHATCPSVSMNTGFQQYLQRFKRKTSSTSSSECSPERQALKHTPKKHRDSSAGEPSDLLPVEETEKEETMETVNTLETLTEINKQLAKLATKDDVEALTTRLMDRIEKMEGRIFELEQEKDSLKADARKIRDENCVLKQQLQSLKLDSEKKHNESEQYSRRWNLRLFGIKESTSEDCVAKSLKLFNDKVGVKTKDEDIQVAHRVKAATSQRTQHGGAGEQERKRPPAIIVQFSSRRVRDKILQNRKVLAKSGFVIAEDLTYKNFKLLQAAQEHSATTTAWSSNGKVIAQLKNGKKLRVEINTDLDAFFGRHMTS